MRIALLSNITVSVLAEMLKSEHSVWLAPGFGAWMETALAVPPELREFAPQVIYLFLDHHFEGARGWAEPEVTAAVASLKAALSGVTVVVPDLAALAADFGERFYDERMWHLAQMPFSLVGLQELRKLFGYKKVLAVDLDQTLWTGVIGEDGVQGIVPKVEFQRELKELQQRGVLLVALSKNNAAEVTPVWDDPRMVLKREDFVAMAINWEDKSANLRRIAAELNLGLEAFVFIDDNPVERMQMRTALPEVCVAEFPPRLKAYFPFSAQTREDAAKTSQYQAAATRRNFAAGLTAAEYLQGLEIWTEIHPIREDEYARVAQLSQKANQFNVTTRRWTVDEVRRLAQDPQQLLVTLHAGDRFGDEGLVAFVRAEIVGARAEIGDWVMSCRVMNRRLEYAVEDEVERRLKARGVRQVGAKWIRTAKNEPVRELFERFGFQMVRDDGDAKRYERDL